MYKNIIFHEGTDLKRYYFLVTGGAGFIGSHIVEYLLTHGAKVRVLDDLSTGSLSNVRLFRDHPNYDFLEGDIRDYDTCVKACEGIDLISHQAAIGSVPRSIANPTYTNSVNVTGFVNILLAAKEQGIKRIVYASSSSVYGDEITLPKKEEKIGALLSPYAVSKYANELYASVFGKVYAMELIGFRYFNIFGPRQSPKGAYAAVIPLFIEGILNEKDVFINGDGLQTRDFTFVQNAVQANIRGMLTTNQQATNQIYNIAVGERFSILDLFNKIAKQLNKTVEPIHRQNRLGDVRDSLADISKAENLLAYKAQIKFTEGLNKTIFLLK